jgi:hypothetical protein
LKLLSVLAENQQLIELNTGHIAFGEWATNQTFSTNRLSAILGVPLEFLNSEYFEEYYLRYFEHYYEKARESQLSDKLRKVM